MSHFSVLVIGGEIEAQMAPYDENLTFAPHKSRQDDPAEFWAVRSLREEGLLPDSGPLTAKQVSEAYNGKYGYPNEDEEGLLWDEEGLFEWSSYNPESKWDYWRIGGRWTGALLLKPGRTGHREPLSWEWRDAKPEDLPPADAVDQAKKDDVDISRMRSEAANKASAQYDAFEALVEEHGPLPDTEWLDKAHKTPGYATTERFKTARDAYWKHPLVLAMREAELVRDWGDFPNELYGEPRERYVERARLAILPGFATLYRRRWLAPGRMGWFGVSSDTPDDRWGYLIDVNRIIDEVPSETLLTYVDCHI